MDYQVEILRCPRLAPCPYCHGAANEIVNLRSFDGVEISGFLYRPPARFAIMRP